MIEIGKLQNLVMLKYKIILGIKNTKLCYVNTMIEIGKLPPII